MQAVWSRIFQLAGGGGAPLSTLQVPTAVLLDPALPMPITDLVPEVIRADQADWLPWKTRAELLYSAAHGSMGEEVRVTLDDGRDVAGVVLGVEHLPLGVLVSGVPAGGQVPWTRASAVRLSETLASGVAPRLLDALRAEQQFRHDLELLQLRLERVGNAAGEVGLLGADRTERARASFHGVVATGCSTASYLGSLSGGPSPAGFVPVVMSLLSRWFQDLPDPDPSTVIDAVHTDLTMPLGSLGIELELTVVVPKAHSVAVSTTSTVVAVVRSDGKVTDCILPDGVTVKGVRLGLRRTEDVPTPAGSTAVAIHGVSDARMLIDAVGSSHSQNQSALAWASHLRQLLLERTTLQGSILVHPLGPAHPPTGSGDGKP